VSRPLADRPAARAVDARVQAECIRTLYRQIPNSFAAAMVVTFYMVATALPYSPHPLVWGWLAAQGLSQVYRGWIYFRYRANPPDIPPVDDPTLSGWGRTYAGYMLVAGLVWGATIFLFAHGEKPITLALTLCGLYGIAGGSVPGNAYQPSAIYAFVGSIFGAVALKMAMVHDFDHIVLGLASFAFAGILFMFCRVQHRTLIEGFAIRFENAELLEALKVQTAEAEAARLRAEQANLAKSQFLAAASHDLRQPLYALGLFSASLQALKLDAEADDIVHRIQANIEAMEGLFEGLLDVSKLDAGVIKPQIGPLPVSGLFQRLEQYFAATAADRGLRLRFMPCGAWVEADAMLLERIVGNLIANAIRYTGTGGILVGCRRAGAGRVRVEVWDTGIGISQADQSRIFDEFVQIGNPERDRRKGLGLGLAIAQRTAALMDARVSVRSRPGKGSVFCIDLLRGEPDLTAVEAEPASADDLVRGLSVLVVDDEQTVREALGLLLGRWGVKADVVESGAEAEAMFATGARYRILLADYRLRGGETGFDVVRIARAAQSPPPVCCLITGDMDPDLISDARAMDVALLHKPLRPAKLRALLNHLASDTARAAGSPAKAPQPTR
jgi:signal transduction histidine kinase/ActR/RegA family two-component response regulator